MTPEERAEYRRMAELVKAHGRETATTVIRCGDLIWLLDQADSYDELLNDASGRGPDG